MEPKKPIRKFSPKESALNIQRAIQEGSNLRKVAEDVLEKKRPYKPKGR